MMYKRFIPLLLAVVVFSVLGCSGSKRTPLKVGNYQAQGLPASGLFRTIAVSDLDNDGHLDVAGGGSSPGTVGIWYGDGAGGLTPPYYLPLEADVRFLTIGDFDEDGLKDLAFTVQREASGIQVWKNIGKRQWKTMSSPTEINSYQGIQTADINSDGHLDLIAANTTVENNGGIQVWIGSGTGKWLRQTGPTVTGLYMDVLLADFNGDGLLDLAGAGWGSGGSLKVWLGDGNGGWITTPPVDSGHFYGIQTADMNGDGYLDLLAGTHRGGIRVYIGDGGGRFVDSGFKFNINSVEYGEHAGKNTEGLMSDRDSAELASFWDVFPFDLDGDGDFDILAGSTANLGLKAWENTGRSTWDPIENRFPTEGSYYEIATADLDGDGWQEIFSACFGGGIKLWQVNDQQGSSRFTRRAEESSKDLDSTRAVVVLENNSFITINGIPEYRIGPLDVLEITIWQGLEAKQTPVVVNQVGTISFGFVDDLYVNGLTPSQLDGRLTEILSRFYKIPKVDVTVKEYESKFVNLMGAIGDGRGGTVQYAMKGRTTILDALSGKGGVAHNAKLSDVRVRKKDGQTFTVDLNKSVFQGDVNQNVILDAGDLVYVPWLTEEANRVYVLGEVKSPGIYTFKGTNMKIFDAVMKAGGVTIFAKEEHTKIIRGDITNPEILSADMERLIEAGDQTQNFSLANGDVVYVPRSIIGDIKLFVDRIAPIISLYKTPGEFADETEDFERTNEAIRTGSTN